MDNKVAGEFQQARASTYEALESLRLDVDQWFSLHDPTNVSFDDVVALDFLHRARRTLVAQLRTLEDDFLAALMEQTQSRATITTTTPTHLSEAA